MDVKHSIYNYLLQKKKAISVSDIATFFDVDSFLVEQTIDELVAELKVKPFKNKYMATNYITGTLVVSGERGYIENNNRKIWISPSRFNHASNGDIVSVDILKSGPNPEGVVVNVIEKFKKNKVGTVITKNGVFYIKPDKIKDNYLIKINTAILGDKVLYSKGKLIKDNIYTGKIISSIGNVDDPKMDIYSKLAEYNVNRVFPPAVMEAVSNLPTEVNNEEISSRVDLRNNMIFTIDGDDSKDLDDAVSLKILDNGNYLLGVHIADVSNYIDKDGVIDKEANDRGTSVYPPGCVVPMLPHEISSGICSLFEGKDRLTLTCDMELSPSGKLVNSAIYPSVINSSKRMTYNNVNATLDNNTPVDYKTFEDNLKLMNKLKNVLRHNRMGTGSIDFDSGELKIELDEQGNPTDINLYNRGEAEKLIEEFMLIANTTVATYLANTALPSIYRVHDIPNVDKMKAVIDLINNNGIHVGKMSKSSANTIQKMLLAVDNLDNKDAYLNMILRCMSKAMYSTDNIGHFGLGFDNYTHFTSPIRRYPDLTVHRLIKEYQNIKEPDMAYIKEMNDYLVAVAKHSSLKERNADSCEGAVDRMKMAEFLSNKIGNDFEGTIYSLDRYGIEIELYNGIKGMIRYSDMPSSSVNEKMMCVKTPYKLYRLGDKIDLTLISTDKSTGQINFKEKVLTK